MTLSKHSYLETILYQIFYSIHAVMFTKCERQLLLLIGVKKINLVLHGVTGFSKDSDNIVVLYARDQPNFIFSVQIFLFVLPSSAFTVWTFSCRMDQRKSPLNLVTLTCVRSEAWCWPSPEKLPLNELLFWPVWLGAVWRARRSGARLLRRPSLLTELHPAAEHANEPARGGPSQSCLAPHTHTHTHQAPQTVLIHQKG